ncbi:MAG: DUF2058 family protein [Gammaproteobacteria bacterium]|nr:DUF2058 family protein [Gammaproteobacteria bacterium]
MRDELLKVGLVSEEQARNASRKKHTGPARDERRGAGRKKPRRARGGDGAKRARAANASPSASAAADAPAQSRHGLRENQRRTARIARDAGLAASAGVQSANQARRAQIARLLEEHALKSEQQDIPYHFIRGKRIKRIYVSAEQRAALVAGEIVVVALEGSHYLLATDAAQQLLEIAPNAFVASVSTEAELRGEEGEFPVPDDITW